MANIEQGVVFSGDAAFDRHSAAVRSAEQYMRGTGNDKTGQRPGSREVVLVRITGPKNTVTGRYPGIATYREPKYSTSTQPPSGDGLVTEGGISIVDDTDALLGSSTTTVVAVPDDWNDFAVCQVKGLNGEALTVGTRYGGMVASTEKGIAYVFVWVGGGGGGPSSVYGRLLARDGRKYSFEQVVTNSSGFTITLSEGITGTTSVGWASPILAGPVSNALLDAIISSTDSLFLLVPNSSVSGTWNFGPLSPCGI